MHKDAKSCVKSLRGSTQAQLTNDPLQTSNWRLHRQHHEFVVQKSTNEATSIEVQWSQKLKAKISSSSSHNLTRYVSKAPSK